MEDNNISNEENTIAEDNPDELFKEGEAIMIKLLPPLEYGENEDCERLWNILDELRNMAKSINQ